MTEQTDKPFLPSSSRVAAAAQQGLVLQSPLFWFGLILIVSGFSGVVFFNTSTILSPAYFEDALSQTHLETYIFSQLQHLLSISLMMTLPVAGVAVAAVAVMRRQRRHGQTNVPIPSKISNPADDAVVLGITLLVSVAAVVAIVRNGGFSYLEIEQAAGDAARRLVFLFLWCCVTTGAIFVMGGLIQLALRRIRLLQHLSLTRAEVEREQRLQGESFVRARLRQSMSQRPNLK